MLGGSPVRSDDELRDLYRSRLSVMGYCSELMFYQDLRHHEEKLSAIAAQMNRAESEGAQSVLEIGCGYGELLRFYEPNCSYLGIDLVPEFVAEACRRYPMRRFLVKNAFDQDVLPCDICVLPGVLSSVPESTRLLKRAISLARQTAIFDVTLDGRLPAGYPDLHRWQSASVREVLTDGGVTSLSMIDSGRSWVVFVAKKDSR